MSDHPIMYRLISTITLLIGLVCNVPAQGTAVMDTFQNRIALLGQLIQAESFEQAQMEAAQFTEFMRRHKLPLTPKSLGLLSQVFKANEDDRSATRMLAEAELAARKEPNLQIKAAMLSALIAECRKWDLPEKALACQQLLMVTQDSLNAKKARQATSTMQLQMDSLASLRQAELNATDDFMRIDKRHVWIAAASLGLLLFALLLYIVRSNNHWANLLKKKELEWEIMKGNLQHEAQEEVLATTALALEAAESKAVVKATAPSDQYTMYHGSRPEQIALLIEPNRQVVLYLKSLLSDRFQIETAFTPAEGLQMAHELMPDLIVCDALLNGKAGIDVARQIKLSERTNHVPLVLLTDKFGNDGKLDALRAGAEAWFTRPVIDDEFDASVQRLLDARKVKHEQFSRFQQLFFTENRLQLSDPFLQTTVFMIEQNLANTEFAADEIARKLQLTNTHYTKKLKVLTGKEPVQLIRELRLEKAKVLLEKRAGTPQAISELVGFTNPGTFALAFKEYFGENTLLLYSIPSNRLL
jgi:DNA-binding response OmpR family regulator/tmRNA-binding protein